MKYSTRKKLTRLIGVFTIVVGIREMGIINVNYYQAEQTLNSSSSSNRVGNEPLSLADDKVRVPVSLVDYIPLYKSRTIKGKLEQQYSNGSRLSFSYDLNITVLGICSGTEYRERAKNTILEAARKVGK